MINGVVITDNGDGSYLINGVATATVNTVSEYVVFGPGTYQAVQQNFKSYNSYLEIQDAGNQMMWRSYQDSTTWTIEETARWKFMFRANAGITFDNILIRPQLYRLP